MADLQKDKIRMNRFNRTITTCIFLLSGLCIAQQVMATLANDLQDGQHILLMRHADAPGIGDPAGYVIAQCSTQRNLGDYGKKQAQAIGIWLTEQGIQKAEVFSSPWCRCLDTANLLNKGSVKIEPSLGSFFDEMSLEKRQTKALGAFIKNEMGKQSKAPLILVTHHVNIQAYTGKVVGVGDMVLVRVNKNGEHFSHTIYPSPKP
ncbi:histidine phosphatase family protein [Polynucleobacter nymphae]|uniref:histidine phosphatase family protein n=1 Tax=Polynucleobacter nymphae TaxID=2081043 RepID=UPI002105DC55|nr:histidine phosphatase family protein [Polynucleobacter nymphae]